MKVVSFLATLPSKMLVDVNKHQEKPQTLYRFAAGATSAGDTGTVHVGSNYQPCDVAVILGWVHEHGKDAPHLRLRQEILDQQRARGGRTVIADSNLFLYRDQKNPYHYLRYSFDGVFPDTGDYCDQQPDPARWQQIQTDMGVSLKPWRKHGDHVLVALQRNGGWSMAGFDVSEWAKQTIQVVREFSNRPIVIRSHPGDKKAGRYLADLVAWCDRNRMRSVSVSTNANLLDDLHRCWAMVNHNSSPAVAAAIEGVPVFVTDPARSQAHAVANTDLALIENPQYPDRESWVQRISQFHWSHADLDSGRCWQHMRQRADV